MCSLAAAGRAPTPVSATGTGPTIMVGSPSLVNGTVQVPIRAWYPVTDAYSSFSIHLRWDPAVFGFSSASGTGGVFDPSAGTGTCVVNTAAFDGDGGGVIFACTGYAGTTRSYHLLATISLSPATAGCSALHLYTYGAPDNGDSSSGTLTVNDSDSSPQANLYWDGTSDVGGHACTPRPGAVPAPSPSSPGASGPPAGNCTADISGDGQVNVVDMARVGKAFLTGPGDPNWNSSADLNADLTVNIVDMAIVGKNFLNVPTGCAPGYPYYQTGSWDGALPGGYNPFSYLIFTGAMLYSAGSYDCSALDPTLSGWAFISVTTNLRISACDFASGLKSLADDISLYHFAHGLAGTDYVYFGPNDCMTHFLPPNGSTIAGAASALYKIWVIATLYAYHNDPSVSFQAVVDDEGYTGGACDLTTPPQCQTPDQTFFSDYTGLIGPAGARPCEWPDENTLSVDGHGAAIPQIYVYTGAQTTSCTIDGYPAAAGTWPYSIPYGYAGVQSYPVPHGYYTSWEANIRWSLCHGSPPPVDFDWSFPAGRG